MVCDLMTCYFEWFDEQSKACKYFDIWQDLDHIRLNVEKDINMTGINEGISGGKPGHQTHTGPLVSMFQWLVHV